MARSIGIVVVVVLDRLQGDVQQGSTIFGEIEQARAEHSLHVDGQNTGIVLKHVEHSLIITLRIIDDHG